METLSFVVRSPEYQNQGAHLSYEYPYPQAASLLFTTLLNQVAASCGGNDRHGESAIPNFPSMPSPITCHEAGYDKTGYGECSRGELHAAYASAVSWNDNAVISPRYPQIAHLLFASWTEITTVVVGPHHVERLPTLHYVERAM